MGSSSRPWPLSGLRRRTSCVGDNVARQKVAVAHRRPTNMVFICPIPYNCKCWGGLTSWHHPESHRGSSRPRTIGCPSTADTSRRRSEPPQRANCRHSAYRPANGRRRFSRRGNMFDHVHGPTIVTTRSARRRQSQRTPEHVPLHRIRHAASPRRRTRQSLRQVSTSSTVLQGLAKKALPGTMRDLSIELADA